MGSWDESKPSDPSPSAPLLYSYPDSALSSAAAPPSATAVADDDDQPFPPVSYVYSPRPLRDLPILLIFALFSLSTFAFGFTALALRNSDFPRRHSFIFDPTSSSCALPYSISISNQLQSSSFMKDLIWTLVITLLCSGPIVLALLFSLRSFAKQIIYSAIPFLILIMIFLNIYWFVACQISSSCRQAFLIGYRILVLTFVFVVMGLIIWIIIANWGRVQLTVRIVRRAAAALAANLALLGVLPLLALALLIYFAPIIVFLVFARFNGKIVPGMNNCEWKEDWWVPAYFALAIITMIWSASIMIEAQVYVVSGTIAQWFFSQEESGPDRSLRISLRNAFGPSFGTICFSGMIWGIVRVVRTIIEGATRENAAPGIVNVILQCCFKFMLSAFDFVNKFTINFAAITGESYCSAARMTYDILRRNLLSAVVVETVSTRILAGIVFVLSSLYAIVVCAILKSVSALDDLEVYITAGIAWLLLIVVSGYFVHILDNVIDTTYICYAIDRDKGEVSKQEIHEVFVQLPLNRKYQSRSPFLV